MVLAARFNAPAVSRVIEPELTNLSIGSGTPRLPGQRLVLSRSLRSNRNRSLLLTPVPKNIGREETGGAEAQFERPLQQPQGRGRK